MEETLNQIWKKIGAKDRGVAFKEFATEFNNRSRDGGFRNLIQSVLQRQSTPIDPIDSTTTGSTGTANSADDFFNGLSASAISGTTSNPTTGSMVINQPIGNTNVSPNINPVSSDTTTESAQNSATDQANSNSSVSTQSADSVPSAQQTASTNVDNTDLILGLKPKTFYWGIVILAVIVAGVAIYEHKKSN
jgi:hypothetical protein